MYVMLRLLIFFFNSESFWDQTILTQATDKAHGPFVTITIFGAWNNGINDIIVFWLLPCPPSSIYVLVFANVKKNRAEDGGVSDYG